MGYKPLTRSMDHLPFSKLTIMWKLTICCIGLFPWETMGFPYLSIEISWRTTRFCLNGFVMVCLKTGYGNTPSHPIIHHQFPITSTFNGQNNKYNIYIYIYTVHLYIYIYIYIHVYIYDPFSDTPCNSVCVCYIYIYQNIAPNMPQQVHHRCGEKLTLEDISTEMVGETSRDVCCLVHSHYLAW